MELVTSNGYRNGVSSFKWIQEWSWFRNGVGSGMELVQEWSWFRNGVGNLRNGVGSGTELGMGGGPEMLEVTNLTWIWETLSGHAIPGILSILRALWVCPTPPLLSKHTSLSQ
jgi:hypothetical protein